MEQFKTSIYKCDTVTYLCCTNMVFDKYFVSFGQLICTHCWMWQRSQTVLYLCWTPLKVGTAMESIVCPASSPRGSPAMVGINLITGLRLHHWLWNRLLLFVALWNHLGPHLLTLLSVPECSAGVSGRHWPPCEKEGWVQESPVKDHRGPFPRCSTLPAGFRAGCHSTPQTPGHPETEKAWLPLQTFPPVRTACLIYTQQPCWGDR